MNAGHIAVTDPSLRPTLTAVSIDSGEEMAAIAWSYAALRALDLDAAIVFHADGYRRGGAEIAASFDDGRYFGVPLLQYYGMAARDHDDASEPRYPALRRWLR